jgi:Zn-dependent protease
MARAYTFRRLLGVPVRMRPSLPLCCLHLALFSSNPMRCAAPGAVSTSRIPLFLLTPAICCASVALRHLCHLIVLRHYKIEEESLTLSGWGGSTRVPGKGPYSSVGGVVAAAGPAVTLLLALAGMAWTSHPKPSGQVQPQKIALAVSALNLMLLPGCLIPAWPTDAYRVVHAVAWYAPGDAGAVTRFVYRLSLAVIGIFPYRARSAWCASRQ